MASDLPTVLFLALRNRLEHNPATVYRAVYLGEMIDAAENQGWQTQCLDCDTDGASLTQLILALSQGPSILAIWCEVHQARLALQVARLAKRVAANTKIFVYGRATAFMPQYFERYPFDAVHVGGDRESALVDYMHAIAETDGQGALGVSILDLQQEKFVRSAGRELPSNAWPFPRLDKLPLVAYRDHARRHHGENYGTRVGVTVSKGCHLKCAYCGAHREEGATDRRRDIAPLFRWIDQTASERQGDVVHLFASNLFHDHSWIESLSAEYHRRRSKFSWRGVTTIRSLLNTDVVKVAGKNGCVDIAVGIETLSVKNMRTAKSSSSELAEAVRNTESSGIALKGLVMLGYPGQTEEDVSALEDLANRLKIVLRYTGYTPLHRLSKFPVHALDQMDLESYDRRTFFDQNESRMSAQFFFDKIAKNGGYFLPT